MKKVFILTTLCLSYIANVDAQVDPYDINDGDNVVKISNSDVKGTFIPSEGALELTFKKDTDNMNIIIYKNGKICEQDQKREVLKNETEIYQISDYGSGVYTICSGQTGTIKIVGTIVYR